MSNIAFFSASLNHHQALLADELYEQTGHKFIFIEMEAPSYENTKGGGCQYSNRPYLLKSWKDDHSRQKAVDIALSADVALFGDGLDYLKLRMKKSLMSFEVSERWLKRGWINLFSPRLLKNMWCYHFYHWKTKPIYKLCASAYCANDQYRLLSYKNRCYKWGYFIKVEDLESISLNNSASNSCFSIIWCARFLDWKHPELAVQLARMLKDHGFHVQIDMYGAGIEFSTSKALCEKLGVEEIVSFKGNVHNELIRKEMKRHDLFIFTSDRNEGWGVVLNEAMSCGCGVVASGDIGSVPFLVKDGYNGLIFKSGCLDSLYEKVIYMIGHPDERRMMSQNAYQTIREVWSPHNAAKNLLQLIEDLRQGRDTSIENGPCSKALPIV